MSFSYLNNLNNDFQLHQNPSFGANKSAETNKEPDTPIDKLVKRVDEEKEKKHNKTALKVGGSVIGLSLLLTISNPRVSSKVIEKLRNLQYKTSRNIERNRGDIIIGKFYEVLANTIEWSTRLLQSCNNVNSVKDTYYKKLCTEEKTFSNIRNPKKRKRFEKYDKVFRKIMQKPHEFITRCGDTLAQNTVRRSYESAYKNIDSLENLIIEYADKLPADKKAEIFKDLSEIKNQRQCFSLEQVNSRLHKHESLMSNLNNEIRAHWVAYRQGFGNKFIKNSEHINQNLSFWAHDIMLPDREIVVKEGTERVDSLFGNRYGKIGKYQQIIDKLSGNLSATEKNTIEKKLKKSEKSIRTANSNECEKYFDKKRDLILGSAPTDILSSVIGIITGSIAFASADDRDKKISRLITGIIPVFTGLLTNITLTTMLFSGTKCLLLGAGTAIVLSRIGSYIDKERLAAKNKSPEE